MTFKGSYCWVNLWPSSAMPPGAGFFLHWTKMSNAAPRAMIGLFKEKRQDERGESEPFSTALALLGWHPVKQTSDISYTETLMPR